MQRGCREAIEVDSNLHHLTPCTPVMNSSSGAQGKRWRHHIHSLGGEERGWERNGVPSKALAYRGILYLDGELGVR
jgi:hypothetical protein